jgi:Domain of unknown function (DUF4111)
VLTVLADAPRGRLVPRLHRMRSLVGFSNRIPDDAPPGWQAYAILTMCRGLYALRFGERLSKGETASWALARWADLIDRAPGWRQRQHDPDGQHVAATVVETRSFVAEMAKLALQTGAATLRRPRLRRAR